MKNYTVFVNTERRPFFSACWETVGTAQAKNKKEAVAKIYDAVWGIENDAVILADGWTLSFCTRNASFKAEID